MTDSSEMEGFAMTAMMVICAGHLGFSPSDPSEYQEAAAKAGRDAGAHLKLAKWCEANGMDAEWLKHLASAVLIDPHNAAAGGMMGLLAYGGRWLLPELVGKVVKAGDVIRTLEGRTEVLAVEQGPEQPVFNLDLARNFTFFVGAHKELVHDNSLPPPVLTPFDAEPSLASMAQ
jgi:hypothetical protein